MSTGLVQNTLGSLYCLFHTVVLVFILHLLLQPVVVLCPKNALCNLESLQPWLFPFGESWKEISRLSVVCLSGHALFLLAHCIFSSSVLLLPCYTGRTWWEMLPLQLDLNWVIFSSMKRPFPKVLQMPNFVSNSRVFKMCSCLLLFLGRNFRMCLKI